MAIPACAQNEPLKNRTASLTRLLSSVVGFSLATLNLDFAYENCNFVTRQSIFTTIICHSEASRNSLQAGMRGTETEYRRSLQGVKRRLHTILRVSDAAMPVHCKLDLISPFIAEAFASEIYQAGGCSAEIFSKH